MPSKDQAKRRQAVYDHRSKHLQENKAQQRIYNEMWRISQEIAKRLGLECRILEWQKILVSRLAIIPYLSNKEKKIPVFFSDAFRKAFSVEGKLIEPGPCLITAIGPRLILYRVKRWTRFDLFPAYPRRVIKAIFKDCKVCSAAKDIEGDEVFSVEIIFALEKEGFRKALPQLRQEEQEAWERWSKEAKWHDLAQTLVWVKDGEAYYTIGRIRFFEPFGIGYLTRRFFAFDGPRAFFLFRPEDQISILAKYNQLPEGVEFYTYLHPSVPHSRRWFSEANDLQPPLFLGEFSPLFLLCAPDELREMIEEFVCEFVENKEGNQHYVAHLLKSEKFWEKASPYRAEHREQISYKPSLFVVG